MCWSDAMASQVPDLDILITTCKKEDESLHEEEQRAIDIEEGSLQQP